MFCHFLGEFCFFFWIFFFLSFWTYTALLLPFGNDLNYLSGLLKQAKLSTSPVVERPHLAFSVRISQNERQTFSLLHLKPSLEPSQKSANHGTQKKKTFCFQGGTASSPFFFFFEPKGPEVGQETADGAADVARKAPSGDGEWWRWFLEVVLGGGPFFWMEREFFFLDGKGVSF